MTIYEQIIKKYENKDLNNTQNLISFLEELENKCNTDYDTFVECCKVEDEKEGLTEEGKRITQLYKEWLNENNIPYEDCYFSFYNWRIYIKGVEWFESFDAGYVEEYCDEFGFDGKTSEISVTNTAESVAVADKYLFGDYFDARFDFFSLPAFI